MAAFTTHVRTICENLAGYTESPGYSKINEVLDSAIPKLFDFDFPMYDEGYRDILCRKILKHYYMREIGAETVAQWKFWLDTRLNEIMPYYNQMYKSTLLDFNPLYDVDVTTTRSGKTGGTTDVTGSSTNKDTKNIERDGSLDGSVTAVGESNSNNHAQNVNVFSDTPQGVLDGVTFNDHLTDARKVTNDVTNTQNSNESTTTKNIASDKIKDVTDRTENRTGKTVANTTEEYLEKVQGKQGGVSSSKLLAEYRKTFVNIDTMIIEELSDLFFNLW